VSYRGHVRKSVFNVLQRLMARAGCDRDHLQTLNPDPHQPDVWLAELQKLWP